MEAEYQVAMQNFRVSIRKRQIDRMFQQNRIHLLNSQKDQYSEQLSVRLNDGEYRHKWISELALHLTGQPTPKWHRILLQLFHSVRSFKNEHSNWAKLGILKAVSEVFKPEYQDLGLGKIASQVLVDVIYFSHLSDPKVIKTILSYGCLDNLIQRLSSNFQTEYLRLIASIAKIVPDLREYLRAKGCFQIAVDKIRNSRIKNTQQIKVCLFFIENMVSIYQVDADTYLYPKKSVVMTSLELVRGQIFENYLGSSLKIILGICGEICSLEKEEIFDKIFQFPELIDKALQIFTFQQDSQVCKKSAIFISKLLLSKNPQHTKSLLKMGLLDKIMSAYLQNPFNDSINQSFLSILSNLTADLDLARLTLINHPLFLSFVIGLAQNSPSIGVKREAVYVICNFLHEIDEVWAKKLFNQFNVCEVLANLLLNWQDQRLISEIVEGFTAALNRLGKKFADLLSFLRIEEILAEIDNESSQQCIWCFLEVLGEVKSNDEWVQ